MTTDRYPTLASSGTGQLRENASRFIGTAFRWPLRKRSSNVCSSS